MYVCVCLRFSVTSVGFCKPQCVRFFYCIGENEICCCFRLYEFCFFQCVRFFVLSVRTNFVLVHTNFAFSMYGLCFISAYDFLVRTDFVSSVRTDFVLVLLYLVRTDFPSSVHTNFVFSTYEFCLT